MVVTFGGGQSESSVSTAIHKNNSKYQFKDFRALQFYSLLVVYILHFTFTYDILEYAHVVCQRYLCQIQTSELSGQTEGITESVH